MYMQARGDFKNQIATNGEHRLQREMVSHFGSHSISPIVFDVGANIGDWALSFFEIGANAKLEDASVHLFEPFPSTFNALKERVSVYDDKFDVQFNHVGLSNQIEKVEMYGIQNLGTNSLYLESNQSTSDIVYIETDTIDAYCARKRIETVHFLKVDTEGHDFKVIEGASGMLSRGEIWILQFEYNHRWIYARHYLKDVFDLIDQTDCVVAKIMPDHLEVFSSWHPELERFFEGNYCLVKEELLNSLNCHFVTVDGSNTFA